MDHHEPRSSNIQQQNHGGFDYWLPTLKYLTISLLKKIFIKMYRFEVLCKRKIQNTEKPYYKCRILLVLQD